MMQSRKMQICLVFILLNVLPTFSIESSSKYLNGREYLLNRNKRADGAINQILDKHLPLGRVFNALYLQMELNDKKIDGSDVVAGALNLKNKASLEKLVSLKVDGVAEELKAVEQAVQAVPYGIRQIADVEAIADNYKFVLEIDNTVREDLVNAGNDAKIPRFIIEELPLEAIPHLANNLASKVLEKIKNIEEATEFSDSLFAGSLIPALRECQEVLNLLPPNLETLKSSSESSLSSIADGAEIASNIYKKTGIFTELLNLLSETDQELKKVEPLKNIGLVQTVQFTGEVKIVLSELFKISPIIPIGSAFISKQNFSQINHDLQDVWLKKVLSKDGDSKQLESLLKDFNTLAEKFEILENTGSISFKRDQLVNFGFYSDFTYAVKNFKTFAEGTRLNSFKPCLDYVGIKNPDGLNEIKELSNKLFEFNKVIPNIKIVLDGIGDPTVIATVISDLEPSPGSVRESNFEEYKNGEKFKKMKTFFEDKLNLFERLKQNQSFVDDYNSLSKSGPKIKEIMYWISNLTLATEECDQVFQLDVESLRKINDVPNILYGMRSGDHIKEMQSVVENISKLKSSLSTFNAAIAKVDTSNAPNGLSPSAKKETKSIKDLKLKRQSLLEVAFATRSLEKMKQIEEKKSVFETVFMKGEDACKTISNVKDTEKKSKLEAAWKDFPNFKKDLESFKTSNSKALASLKYVPEKNLKDVGNVYMNITVFKFSRQAELRQMRETMRYFDNPIPSLIDALASIEELLAMDWGLVHANFKKVPNSLVDLQNDFLEFFRVEKEVDPKKVKFAARLNPFVIIGSRLAIGIVIAIALFLFLYWVLVYDTDMVKIPPIEPDYSPPEEKFFEFTYMQVQDARLLMNKRDKKYIGNTPLFDAVMRNDWPTAECLIQQGAVLDATCAGPLCRTVLFEAVLKKKKQFCKKLLKAAADQTIRDATGDDPGSWADRFDMTDLFQNFYDERKVKAPPRIIPLTRRYWKVLVFDKSCFKFYKKKKLPRRIKKHITWGYNEDMDLDTFSHIVLPNKYVKNDVTLLLDEKDLLTFKLLGCWANLMSVKWLNALANRKIHEKAMNRDYEYYVMHTSYRGNHHERTVFKQKTSIHKLQPRLLMNVAVTLMPTKLPYQTNELKALVLQFGGELPKEVIIDDDNCPIPYYSMDIYGSSSQNRCWVLKFTDSKVDPEWKKWPDRCTVSDIQLLFECLARWKVLEHSNPIVKPEEIAPEPEISPDGKSKMVKMGK